MEPDSSRGFRGVRVALASACLLPPICLAADPQRTDGVGNASQIAAANRSDHWSFTAPTTPALPPVVRQDWPRGNLDRFVLSRLETEKLAPSPEADRGTLLRRICLDLTGLPPTPEEVIAFEADSASDAYERAVDRLLASPHYGEKMAIPWLDLARYADSNGFDFDTPREMWAWRDYVIAAFNRNLTFDRFTIEQLAGDLLLDPTLDQRIATGFLRNQPQNYELAGQPGEFEHLYVSDRVNTFSTTWLGLTIGCAQCHDHKFDPISQRDYYGLYAIFNDCDDGGLRGEVENPWPFIRLPSKEQAAQLAAVESRLDRLHGREIEATRSFEFELREFVTSARSADAAREAPASPELRFALDGEVPGEAVLGGIGKGTWVPGVEGHGKAILLDGNNEFVDCGKRGEMHADRPFTISAYLRIEGRGANADATVVGRNDGEHEGRGYRLSLATGRLAIELASGDDPKDSIKIVARDRLTKGRWHHVVATYDGSRNRVGLRLYVDGAIVPLRAKPAAAALPNSRLAGDILDLGGAAPLLIGCGDGTPYEGAIDDVRLYARELAATDIASIVREQASSIARQDDRGVDQELWLREWFAARESSIMKPIRDDLVAATANRDELLALTPVTSVCERLESPPATHLLVRGDYTNPGDVVEAGVPSVLPPLPSGVRADRLALANWLVRPENPLFARVAVNRLWKQFFGRGLVATSDDFGLRGDLPSHPELLDFLAREFTRSGYDVKALVRTLVTSATYRQSSRVDPAVLAQDPANRSYSRASRIRLDAEIVLDNALAIGGILDPTVYGKSAPIFDTAAANAALAVTKLRRGLYVEVKRSAQNLAFAAFDSSNREVCRADRVRTTTPLQALALMNEPTQVAAARGLGRRMQGVAGDEKARLEYGMRACVGRAPSSREIDVLVDLLGAMRSARAPRQRPASPAFGSFDPRLQRAEAAAWSDVANVLLNLDETSTRG